MRATAIALVACLIGTPCLAAEPQTFACTDAEDTVYFLHAAADGTLQAQQKDTPTIFTGAYRRTSSTIELSLPQAGFAETSVAMDERAGLLLAFATPTLRCAAIGHERGPAVNAYVRCPAIKHIPGTSYEKNAFQFFPERGVMRRRWRELVAANDTLYKEFIGIYVIEGDRLWMAFGLDDSDERILTARINADQTVSVDQLEPSRGACVAD